MGLSFKLKRYIPDNVNRGYTIAFHLPSELPRLDKTFVKIPSDKSVVVTIDPVMIISDQVDGYNSKSRQCYYQKEKLLDNFNDYTKTNCQLECVIFETRSKCSCIPPYFPQVDFYRMCDMRSKTDVDCVENVYRNVSELNVVSSLESAKSYEDLGNLNCDCLSPCTSLNFNAELSYSDNLR